MPLSRAVALFLGELVELGGILQEFFVDGIDLGLGVRIGLFGVFLIVVGLDEDVGDGDAFRHLELLDVFVVFLLDIGIGDFLFRLVQERGVRISAEGGDLLDLGIFGSFLHVFVKRLAACLQHVFDLFLSFVRKLVEFLFHLLHDDLGGGLETGLFGQLEHDFFLHDSFDLLLHGLAEAFLADALQDRERDFLRNDVVNDHLAGDGVAVDSGEGIGEECEEIKDFRLGCGLHVHHSEVVFGILDLGLRFGRGGRLGGRFRRLGGFVRLFVSAGAEGRGGDAGGEDEREGFSGEFHGVHVHSCFWLSFVIV